MSQETSDFILGAVIFVISIPVLYFFARFVSTIGDAWSASQLAPLAPVIGGAVTRDPPQIQGSYQGRNLRVSFTPGQNVGAGEGASQINAFQIETLELAGRQDWRIKFYLSGFFGQGAKQLLIEVQDKVLGERLESSGVLAEIAGVNSPTQPYVTVAYDARQKILTYTDDMTPHKLPTREQFAAQLKLVARLADVNQQVNSL
jgi:hypothetical protein